MQQHQPAADDQTWPFYANDLSHPWNTQTQHQQVQSQQNPGQLPNVTGRNELQGQAPFSQASLNSFYDLGASQYPGHGLSHDYFAPPHQLGYGNPYSLPFYLNAASGNTLASSGTLSYPNPRPPPFPTATISNDTQCAAQASQLSPAQGTLSDSAGPSQQPPKPAPVQQTSSSPDTGGETGYEDLSYTSASSVENDPLLRQELHKNGKPRRPLNSFMIFSRWRRPTLQREKPHLKVADIAKELSAEWKVMDPEQKQFFNDKAKVVKEYFHKSFPDYVYRRRPNGTRSGKKKRSTSRAGTPSSESSAKGKKRGVRSSDSEGSAFSPGYDSSTSSTSEMHFQMMSPVYQTKASTASPIASPASGKPVDTTLLPSMRPQATKNATSVRETINSGGMGSDMQAYQSFNFTSLYGHDPILITDQSAAVRHERERSGSGSSSAGSRFSPSPRFGIHSYGRSSNTHHMTPTQQANPNLRPVSMDLSQHDYSWSSSSLGPGTSSLSAPQGGLTGNYNYIGMDRASTDHPPSSRHVRPTKARPPPSGITQALLRQRSTSQASLSSDNDSQPGSPPSLGMLPFRPIRSLTSPGPLSIDLQRMGQNSIPTSPPQTAQSSSSERAATPAIRPASTPRGTPAGGSRKQTAMASKKGSDEGRPPPNSQVPVSHIYAGTGRLRPSPLPDNFSLAGVVHQHGSYVPHSGMAGDISPLGVSSITLAPLQLTEPVVIKQGERRNTPPDLRLPHLSTQLGDAARR